MAITPQTDLFLVKCPLQLSNKHQLTFNSKDEQFNYFRSLPRIELDQISYIRKDNVIRFNQHIDSLLEYNYCFYQNENYSNKWFYAFIVRMEYVNDNCTNIYIKQDVWQTWQFDLVYLQSFVEREMVNVSDDIPGNNREPEGLEFGEPKVLASSDINGFLPMYILCYACNEEHDPKKDNLPYFVDDDNFTIGGYINGMASGVAFCMCSNPYGLLLLTNWINGKGFGDFIITIFTVPRLAFLGYDGITLENITNPNWNYSHWYNDAEEKINSSGRTVSLNGVGTSIDSYIPKNKKVLSYPYTYLAITPQNGNSKIFKYENFSGNPSIKIISEINPNPDVMIIPQNYNGKTGDVTNEASHITGYPTVSYQSDKFNAWLAQNQKSIDLNAEHQRNTYAIQETGRGISMVGNLASGLGSALTLDLGGAVGSVFNAMQDINQEQQAKEDYAYFIKSQMAQKEAQSLIPSSANMGTSATLLGYNLLGSNLVQKYGIRREFAEKIDKYFDMYGYQTNTLKVPNINNRPTWNYIKTIECNINANIPQMDLAEIKDLFNSGFTLWHSTINFKNYSANNR